MLIGLLGAKRVGKDTVADRLVAEHGFGRLAFADALKDAAYHLDPIIDRGGLRLASLVDSVGWEAAKSRPEVRRTLQRYGMSIRRHTPDYWTEIVERAVDQRGAANTVVTDVRFPNEAAMIARWSGALVRVVRPVTPDPSDPTASHISETALVDFPVTHTLINDRDVAHLHRLTDELVRELE